MGLARGSGLNERPERSSAAPRAVAGAIKRPVVRLVRRVMATWTRRPLPPWTETVAGTDSHCTICGWHGVAFLGGNHAESATCPRCRSVARDRFLVHCLARRVPYRAGLRLLETSPRLGDHYRLAMRRWFDYLASDYDERGHRGAMRIDLQAIDLADESIDVVLTPHVLEHVPDTDRAIDELHRILSNGGWLILQVPVLQGHTAPPVHPEFHDDDTPVWWRFGFDLTQRLRSHGFAVELLCTEALRAVIDSGATRWPDDVSPEFDVEDMLTGVIPDDLVVIADDAESSRSGFEPGYMFFTWACQKQPG
jgi:SAM-dependent methyltransferase